MLDVLAWTVLAAVALAAVVGVPMFLKRVGVTREGLALLGLALFAGYIAVVGVFSAVVTWAAHRVLGT